MKLRAALWILVCTAAACSLEYAARVTWPAGPKVSMLEVSFVGVALGLFLFFLAYLVGQARPPAVRLPQAPPPSQRQNRFR